MQFKTLFKQPFTWMIVAFALFSLAYLFLRVLTINFTICL